MLTIQGDEMASEETDVKVEEKITFLADTMSDYACFPEVFTQKEVDRIRCFAKTLSRERASVLSREGENSYDVDINNKSISSLEFDDDTAFIFNKINTLVLQANDTIWQFKLSKLGSLAQVCYYEAQEQSGTAWHIDNMGTYQLSTGERLQDKLTIILFLSHPDEYQGGELKLMRGQHDEAVPNEKGTVIVFPKYLLHRVTPLIQGTRENIIFNYFGPPFQ